LMGQYAKAVTTRGLRVEIGLHFLCPNCNVEHRDKDMRTMTATDRFLEGDQI
jgi:predicted RNA-binding Zn-ribbon protein involved in translation (DUF1610 family)